MTPTKTNPYLEATLLVPAGETRSFSELAALAGRPGAARAAGRAIAACAADAPYPWHRIVSSDGSYSPVEKRARIQRERLRAEGALPDEGEKRGNKGEKKIAPQARKAPRRARIEPRPEARKRAREDTPPVDFESRLAAVDWTRALEALRTEGIFLARGLLTPAECGELAATFDDDSRFERTIQMGPRGYGVGTYRYFREPMPEPAGGLRAELYRRLRDLSAEAPGASAYPPSLEEFWEACRARGQKRASSILLRYAEGGVNFPHRDVYGPVWFPYQAVCVLSRRGDDFEGGAFTLFEEEAAGAPRERAYDLDAGDLAIFASRGFRRKESQQERFVGLKHGMRPITRGARSALGLVLHLAE